MRSKKKDLANKLKALVYADDRAGELLWNILSPTLLYSAELHGEIADDIVAIDHAMKWGFGWEQGPFETWDAIGVEKSVQKMKEDGVEVPAWVKEMLEKGLLLSIKKKMAMLYFYDNGEYQASSNVIQKVIDLKKI